MWYIWLIASGIFFVAEIITVGFFIFWLGIAALLAMFTSFIIPNIFVQTAVFVISSIILIFATRPLVNKFVNTETELKTNIDSIIGKTGIVTQDINTIEGTGQVKVSGEIWSAITSNEDNIEKGTKVTVIKVNGVKLIVEPIKVINNI